MLYSPSRSWCTLCMLLRRTGHEGRHRGGGSATPSFRRFHCRWDIAARGSLSPSACALRYLPPTSPGSTLCSWRAGGSGTSDLSAKKNVQNCQNRLRRFFTFRSMQSPAHPFLFIFLLTKLCNCISQMLFFVLFCRGPMTFQFFISSSTGGQSFFFKLLASESASNISTVKHKSERHRKRFSEKLLHQNSLTGETATEKTHTTLHSR